MNKVLLLLVFVSVSFGRVLFHRDVPPPQWTQVERACPHDTVKISIALRQYNLDTLKDMVLTKSDPTSPFYGNHLSIEKVLQMIAPPPVEVEPVLQWLRDYRVAFRLMGDVIKAEASVAQIEDMFATEMFLFQHDNGKTRICNLGAASIPDHLDYVITLVAGLTEFPFYKELQMRSPDGNTSDPGVVVPQLLQSIYQTPSKFPVNAESSNCVVEFMNDSSYSKTDLKHFEEYMNVPPFEPRIVGPFSPSSPDAESTLDIQYGGAVVLNTEMWFWTTAGWMYEFATDLFNTNPAPWVVSMSWGWPEPAQCQTGVGNCSVNGWTSQEYVLRVDIEFMKISARGISLFAASGDQGAPGDLNPGCNPSGKNVLSNLFPASSPWVTAVGATMLNVSTNKLDYDLPPICKDVQCATNGTEVVCSFPQALITTGGGFSTYSARPSWQDAQVNAYLDSGVELPPKKDFNSTNRAYPDISALGHNYIIEWGGMAIQVDGTSCSSPYVAGMFALLNSVRLNANKTTLGFVNPLLYRMANVTGMFNDFTTGNNKCTENCCGNIGFESATGWDPVTGLGSPNFPAMVAYVSKLP